MTRKDPLSILEAAYSFEPDERTWMEGIVRAARPYDLGGGVAVGTIELGQRLRYRSIVAENVSFDPGQFLEVHERVPASLFRRGHLPSPAVFNADMLTDLLRAEKMSSEELRETMGEYPTGWGVLGGDASAETILLCLPTDRRSALRRADRVTLDAVGAHLGAALRLRSVLCQRAPSADDRTTEAVIAPGGKVLDVRAEAQSALATLIDGAKRTERARSRKASAKERLALWTALFDGQWSIVDSTDTDGKRMMLACRNEPRTTPLRNLSARERSVIAYAALGHPYKYIAYELGVTAASVSSIAGAALRKLGVKSRAELIRAFGAATEE